MVLAMQKAEEAGRMGIWGGRPLCCALGQYCKSWGACRVAQAWPKFGLICTGARAAWRHELPSVRPLSLAVYAFAGVMPCTRKVNCYF